MISTNIHDVEHIRLMARELQGHGTIFEVRLDTEATSISFTAFCGHAVPLDRLEIAVAAFNAALNGAPAEPAGEVSAPDAKREPDEDKDDWIAF